MATGITIDEVTNTLDDIQGTEKIPVSSGISEPEVVTTGDLKDYINGGMQEEISDLSTIRSGASAGATAYQKPSSGIPSTDLASAVQTSLGKADTALQSFTETDPTVPSWAKQSSKPSYAVGEISGAQETLVSGTNIKTINGNSVLGSGNISIQGGDANVIESISFNGSSVPVDNNKNAAITYTAPVTSVNGNTGAVVISVPTKVSDLTNDAGYITSYTEIDPVFSASAAASITSTDIAAWNGKSDFSGSYNDLTDKPTIPTVPTTLSSFTDDLGSSPTHTHSQYLTSAPVTSVNGQTGAVSLSIPTESTVSGWGFTKNAGTITGVTMNGASKGTSGVVDLGTVITAHQDISGKENTSNKVTSLSSSSTDTEYPSAKCVWDLVGDIETILASI